MIKLSAATVALHPLMGQLKAPPTHAKLVDLRYSRAINTVTVPTGYSGQPNHIQALYAFGSLDATGSFVPSTVVVSVQTAVGLKAPENPTSSVTLDGVDLAQKAQAIANLIGAGVSPTPGSPHVAIAVPSKQAGDFKERDFDAVAAFYDKRLGGDVI